MTEIRNAQRDDAHAIAAVHVESWQAAYQGLLPDSVLAGLSRPRPGTDLVEDPG